MRAFIWRSKTPTMENFTTRLSPSFCRQSVSGMAALIAILQQYSPPHRLGLVWIGRSSWWPFAKWDEMPTNPESLRPSNGLPQIASLRTDPGSQTQMHLLAGGNASTARAQTWSTPWAWNGTHLPNSLEKPLPEIADLHAETQQMHPDQKHPEVLPES